MYFAPKWILIRLFASYYVISLKKIADGSKYPTYPSTMGDQKFYKIVMEYVHGLETRMEIFRNKHVEDVAEKNV